MCQKETERNLADRILTPAFSSVETTEMMPLQKPQVSETWFKLLAEWSLKAHPYVPFFQTIITQMQIYTKFMCATRDFPHSMQGLGSG